MIEKKYHEYWLLGILFEAPILKVLNQYYIQHNT